MADNALEYARQGQGGAAGRKVDRDADYDNHGDGMGQMDQSLALTIPTEKELQILLSVGKTLIASGVAKHLNTPEAALTVILTGREMGLAPMASIRGIDLIMDRPFVKPILMLAVARRSGQLERFDLVKTETKATCTIRRRGYDTKTFVVTIEDAKKRGWFDKNAHNYKSQPATMLGHRVTGEALKDQFTDYFMGMGLPGDEGMIENFRDARESFHENDAEKHVNAGEIIRAGSGFYPEQTAKEIEHQRKMDDPQYESAIEAEIVDPQGDDYEGPKPDAEETGFIVNGQLARAQELCDKIIGAGHGEKELADILDREYSTRALKCVKTADYDDLIAQLSKILTSQLKAKKTSNFK